MRDWLEPFDQEMQAADRRRDLLESTSLLRRIIYHVGAESAGRVPGI